MIASLIELIGRHLLPSFAHSDPGQGLKNRGNQNSKSVPCDLHPNAEQNERNNSQNAVRSRRRNDLGDLWSIRVAEISEHTENHHSKKYANMGLNISRNITIRDVSGECQQRDKRPRARGYGKGEWIERCLLKVLCPCFGSYLALLLLVLNNRACIPLVQYRPSHRRYHNAAGELDDRQRDSEELENGRAQKFNDGQKDDVIDCDLARQRPIDGWWCFAGEAKKHESGPSGLISGKSTLKAIRNDFQTSNSSPLTYGLSLFAAARADLARLGSRGTDRKSTR